MKIAIDLQTTLGEKTGIGFYVDGLVRALARVDTANSYVPLTPNTTDDLNSVKRFLWDQFDLPRLAKRANADLLHQPGFSAPVRFGKPVVVTVHDLIAIHFGSDIPLGSRLYFGKWMPFSYRYADHIIAVSEHTKRDIVKLLGINPTTITVVPLAADERYTVLKDKAEVARLTKRFQAGEKFVLHVGTINPRKNLEFLVRAFAKVRANLNEPVKLVITGKKGWYYDQLFALVDSLKLHDSVVFTGYVTDDEKVALYNAATALAFPSLYEGFGLPPLEAMQCGTPVISSNTSSIPEVIGNAGVLLSPIDESGWVTALTQVLSDPKERARLSKLGLAQAAKFSWDETARKTMAVYEQVIHAKS